MPRISKTERDNALALIFQEGHSALTAADALGFLEDVLSLGRRLEAIYLRRCNGYGTAANNWDQNDPVARARDDVAAKSLREHIEARFEGVGLSLILNTDPRGSALGIATPKTGKYNGMGGHEDGWRLSIEELTGRGADERQHEPDRVAQVEPSAFAVEQKKTGNRLVLGSDVLAVLQAATAEGSRVILPPGRLARDLYVKVDEALKLAGGKWDRKAGAHIFKDEDGAAVLDSLLTAGEILDRKTALQAFYTPASVAARAVEIADVQPNSTVLEPSAGAGALAIPARERGAAVFCVEMDPIAVGVLRERGFPVCACDFMATDGQTWPHDFDRVVMNPPFTRQQDARHVIHAARFLKPGGRLVAIMSPSAPVRTTGPGAEFLALVEAWGGTFEAVDAGAFKESGTSIATVILTLNRPEA